MLVNLKKMRVAKGLSQQKLANVLGVSQQSVNKYENHNVEPDVAILIALADYFDTTIDYLVGRNDSDEPLRENELTHTEEKLLRKYRTLDTAQKECVHSVIEQMGRTDR